MSDIVNITIAVTIELEFMKLKLLYLFLIVSLSVTAFDEYNNYLWNRKNVLSNNGKTDTSPWFEWWYYKLNIPDTDESFYIVYGVVNPWDTLHTLQGTRSFVGFGSFKHKINITNIYPVTSFQASYTETKIEISDYQRATDTFIKGQVTDENKNVYSWDLKIRNNWSFNAMGWSLYTYEFLNIGWFPAQADALCTGKIVSATKEYEIKDAPCYQDKNWGTSFPKWWTWIVSNKFDDNEDAVLVAGGGLPKIFGLEFYAGVSIGLKYRGQMYSFIPNHLSYIKTNVLYGKWEVSAENLKYKIKIEASAPKEEFMDLQFMTPQGTIFHDYETLNGKIKVQLYERTVPFSTWKMIAELTTKYGGIEYGSETEFE